MTDEPAGTVTDPTEDRASLVEELPTRRRVVIATVGVVFWGWLLARWASHNSVLDAVATTLGFPDLVRSGVPVSARTGWIPAAPFEAIADAAAGVVDALGPASPLLEWLVWLADLAAFATTTAPALAEGAFITVYLTILSLLFGLIIAIPVAVARTYGGRLLRAVALGYTELIRGTPLLAQLFFVYYGLPLANVARQLGIDGQPPIPRAAAAVAIVGFTINSSAYQAEYIRSALESVDSGQVTAARSVGLSKLQAIRHVVLPQGLRLAIPGWTNEFVYLIKYSSLASFITVPDLFARASDIGSDTFQFTDIYVIVAVFYLALVLTTALAMGKLETAVSIPGLGQSTGRD
ncbi:Glutamine transport system permease protein glnP [Halorhabdus tiamatea SARL4B]|uniref:Glutamine transport system permease protein glnP n=1 Tax=Halorhabdus tiamatea SARL4B TaxID=1033806 RepID=F7PQ89_9EURY|nr:amino acid ABC transporter permease [Halorhabdus tiamatea]ERJ04973.1 Glutamine transport system permease protein glnP [Halorhabdus tiamatea SARL4B]CCQ33217.1 polar amino acid ABC transporter inner membrane subunit [Halorhabdus tiamatea SARL4B]